MIKILVSLVIIAILIWGVAWFFTCDDIEGGGKECSITAKFNTNEITDKVLIGVTKLGSEIDVTEGEPEGDEEEE